MSIPLIFTIVFTVITRTKPKKDWKSPTEFMVKLKLTFKDEYECFYDVSFSKGHVV